MGFFPVQTTAKPFGTATLLSKHLENCDGAIFCIVQYLLRFVLHIMSAFRHSPETFLRGSLEMGLKISASGCMCSQDLMSAGLSDYGPWRSLPVKLYAELSVSPVNASELCQVPFCGYISKEISIAGRVPHCMPEASAWYYIYCQNTF